MKKLTCILLVLTLLLTASACQGAQAETTTPETTVMTIPTETIPPVTETVPPTTVATEQPTEPTEPALDESWFDDALFIGESRTMGLKMWGRLGNADYFCAESLTVYGVFDIEASDINFYSQRLNRLLSGKTYGKVYIHLGINEVGGNLDKFAAQYLKLIDLIREKQPDAHIILQAVVVLSKDYSSNAIFRQENIQAINDRIRQLSEDEGLFFSDVNQLVADENGYLNMELSFDGCHLHETGYQAWAQWLLEEASSFDIP